MRSDMHARSSGTRSGFTLLEVILAIAILALSLAGIGEVVRSAFSNASQAADGLEARIVAQGIVDQIKCGVIEIADAGPMPMGDTEALGDWEVQIIVEPTNVEELLQVRVLVGREIDARERPSCELVRWFQNPEYAVATAAATTN